MLSGPQLLSNSNMPLLLMNLYGSLILHFLTAKLRLCFIEAVYVSNQGRSGNAVDSTGLPEKHSVCGTALRGPFNSEA